MSLAPDLGTHDAEKGIASNAGSFTWRAVEAATSSVQLSGNKGLRLKTEIEEPKLCDAIVTMVQATDFWKSNDPADRLYGT